MNIETNSLNYKKTSSDFFQLYYNSIWSVTSSADCRSLACVI